MYYEPQNLLKNEELVGRLVTLLELLPSDVVVDIGAGKGIITKELVKQSDNVIAVESNPELFEELRRKFSSDSRIKLMSGELLRFKYPETEFKTFSNPPVLQSSEIIFKLLSQPTFSNGFLVLQKDIANITGGEQLNYQNSVRSLIYHANFEIKVVYSIKREEFRSLQRSDFLLIRFVRRSEPFILPENMDLFKDFISFCFTNSKSHIGSLNMLFSSTQFTRFADEIGLGYKSLPSNISFEQYSYLFNFLLDNFKEKVEIFRGQYQKNNQLNSAVFRL